MEKHSIFNMEVDNRKKPIISICLPTYNGEKYLAQTLRSLNPGENQDIEIVVCDDASTDATVKVVEKFKERVPNIRLYKNRRNLGFDRNMIRVAKKARGEYCWYMGQDDYLKKGVIKPVKAILKKQPTLLMTNFARYDNQMKKFTAQRMIEGQSQHFQDSQEYYFKRTKRSYFPFLGVNLIYISILVFNRRLWLKALHRTPKHYINSDYFHTFVMTRLISEYPKISYLSKPIVVYRDKNIRAWTNKDIWGHYVKVYLPYVASLGWNPLKVKYAQWVVKIHNSPKRGSVAQMKRGIYRVTGAARKALGIGQTF